MMDRAVPRAIVPLIGAAMVLFVVTVAIGILNGTDLVKFSHNQLLAHVHAGTLGWITLSVFAAAAWILGTERVPPALVWLSVIAVALYVLAFWLGILSLRPLAGTLMLLDIFWFTGWAFSVRKVRPPSVTSLSILLSLITLCIGGVLGVLLGLKLAGMADWVPDAAAEGHPATMVAGYLILAGTALAEQLLGGSGSDKMTKPGVAQAILLFGGGLALAIGLLADLMPLLLLNLVGEVVGTAFVVVRLWKPMMGAGWGTAGPKRHAAAAVLFLIPAILLLAYVIGTGAPKNFANIPLGYFLALDHMIFIGVLTNSIFGIILMMTAARRNVAAAADHVVFWGINLGLVAFVLGLLLDQAMLKRIGTPIMGLSILLGLAVGAMRLSGGAKTAAAAPAA